MLTLLLFVPFVSLDMGGAARDLARNAAAAVAHDPVKFSMQNLSSLGPAETAEIRRTFEGELQAAGAVAAEVQVTISENLTDYLLVAEIRRAGERQVLMESWPRSEEGANQQARADQPQRVRLEKKLLWEQEQPILDAVAVGDTQLMLDMTRVLLERGSQRESVPIVLTRPWPRDPRGRLSVSPGAAGAFTVFLPGTICQGSAATALKLECRATNDPWLLGPGAIASFAPDRDYFTGRIDIEPGGARDVPPFYAAAPAADGWIFAGLDGRAHVYTHAWEPASTIDQWGSDLAAIETPCGARVLATRPASNEAGDSIQSYSFGGGAALADGAPLEFGGPITALWPYGASATVVSHDLQTGRYAAFSVVPICGN